MTYAAPVDDIVFALNAVGGLGQVAQHCAEPVPPELLRQILDHAARFASGTLAPLNRIGDQAGVTLENGVVRTAPGFKEAYAAYAAGGWPALPFAAEHGGQGLPWMVCFAVQEMLQSANMAWALCPMLTTGAIEVLIEHGSESQKQLYLPRLMSGEWTASMDLTEPQAGSDLAAIRTRATRDGRRYRMTGQKVFITYGDHDWTDNIVHLVLARLPDAPPGVKGLSLFLIPKFRLDPQGGPGERNDMRAVSLERKLGIHGAPTCTMAYGDNGAAVAELVGRENDGIACMFTLMNNARLQVGLQGLAIAERAYQQALAYARTRIQGREVGGSGDPVPILRHPDVRRMLLSVKSQIEAMRGLIYSAAASLDFAKRHPDAAQRRRHQARIDLLTPVVKAWCTESGIDAASTGVQIHGGAGFIEETGAAQHYRDIRISAIYEGSNGIQANDLVFRKVARDRGAAARDFLAEVAALDAPLTAAGDRLTALRQGLAAGRRELETATGAMLTAVDGDPRRAAAGATPYLRLFGVVAGAAALARGALAAATALDGADSRSDFYRAKLVTARFYADHILCTAPALAHAARHGADAIIEIADQQF